MGPIGKNSDIVNLLYSRTKIKKRDICDIIKALPECMAEAFIMSNVDEKQPVNLGGIAIRWNKGGKWGMWLTVKANTAFKLHLSKLKIMSDEPLAKKMNELMLPSNKKKAIQRIKDKSQ